MKRECKKEKMFLETAKQAVSRANYIKMARETKDKFTYYYCRTCQAYHIRTPKSFKNWL